MGQSLGGRVDEHFTCDSTSGKKRKTVSREEGIADFWRFSSDRESLTESERLHQIKVGFPADLIQVVRLAFDLQDRHLATLLNASTSTLERRRREQKHLDPVASERLDRIAVVSHLAEEILETPVTAAHWMSTPNKALGGAPEVQWARRSCAESDCVEPGSARPLQPGSLGRRHQNRGC